MHLEATPRPSGLGFFAEGGAASDIAAANNASLATDNGWTVTGGTIGGSAGGDVGADRFSIGGQIGVGAILTDSEIIP